MKNFKIYLGDCESVLTDLNSESIDLTITSPPYENLRSFGLSENFWNLKKFEKIAKELYRVTQKGGVIVWIVNDVMAKGAKTGTSFQQALYFKGLGFNIHDVMIWEKILGHMGSHRCYIPSFEYMFIFSKGKIRCTNLITDRVNKDYHRQQSRNRGRRGYNGDAKKEASPGKIRTPMFGKRTNIWKIPGDKANKTGHPAVYPLSLARDHIKSWSNPGDVVLDPFLGSGTSGIAAIELGREFIGIELNRKYHDIAYERIASAIRRAYENRARL